ncbi:phage major capsid protein, P2 family [Aliivibrio fischeri]|uniref:phage major capsid protein, P2 family n=1 Tax=Aliivibrio fischeri TaxID=668 RepID=UPI0012D9CEE3|nr:phage major capsid protein, P2 family [Aliivibrio fischeri]MUK91560.1 phage major capsid protein, P2 family [Aliivibrio fischeri]
MQLTQVARALLDEYCAKQCEVFKRPDVSKQFAISGPIETQLKNKLMESVDFLTLITVEDVDQKTGQVIEVGTNKLHTGRKKGGRHTTSGSVDGNTYNLVETDSCAVASWDLLSVWANSGKPGEFMKRLNENAMLNFAQDILRVGFNGTSIAETTNPTTSPNGEDVNKGWNQLVLEKSPKQIIDVDVYLDPDGGGDYRNLDAMASDLINTKIHPALRNDPNLVVLVGADLLSFEQARLYDAATTPTEKKAAQQLPNSIAGRRAMSPPFFPGMRMTVTTLKNLHVYTQKNTRHRKSEHSEERKQHENSYLRYEGYAVGAHEGYASFNEAKVHFGATPAQ